jgi:hypothetical protein
MKAKPVILIIATFIIGFILGMLTSAQIRYHKLNPVRFYFSEQRFRDGFYRIIQPDEDQKSKIDVVLDKYAKINSDLQSSFRKEFDASMKQFRKEIDTYLTKEQIARLREMDERRQRMIHHNRMIHRNDSLDFRPGGRRHYQDRPPEEGEPFDHPHHMPDMPDSVVNK